LLARGTAAPAPAVGNLAVAFALSASRLPALPSQQKMKPNLIRALEDEEASALVEKNLSTFRDELTKKKTRPKDAAAHVKKAVKEFHFEHHAMPAPMTQTELTEALVQKKDVGLGGLLAAFTPTPDRRRIESFVNLFFGDQQFGGLSGVFAPERLSSPIEEKKQFYFWRSQDDPARRREFAAVRDEVRAAWKLDKARQLARREAERLEKQINAAKGDRLREAERILAEQKRGPVFELRRVAPLVPPEREVALRARTTYRDYTVPEERSEEFPYPPFNLARLLLGLERPGDAIAFADVPVRHYYVAVLLDREEPTLKSFVALYQRTPAQDRLYERFAQEKQGEFRRKLEEQLRKESGAKLDTDGRYELPESVRRRESGRSIDEE
jgi:hypothetical protein